MKRWLPRSMAGRTILILLVGLTATHLTSMAIYSSYRTDAVIAAGGRQVAARVATISRLIDETPPDERPRILNAINSPVLRVVWTRESALPPTPRGQRRALFVARRLAAHLDVAPERIRVRIGRFPVPPPAVGGRRGPPRDIADMMARHMGLPPGGPIPRVVAVSLRLTDSTWLNFSTPLADEPPFWSTRFALSVTLMLAVVVFLSIWVVRRMSAPLTTFAEAAERFGKDVRAPPLPEGGPREIGQAARAFNEMQARLRNFIHDRTRMLAAVSHDLRTPITRLRLRAEFVENGEQQEKMLSDLEEMEEMIASTLAFARDDAADEPRTRVDLTALAESLCDDMADAGLDVTCEGSAGPPCDCRPLALRRALGNLIDNALKFGGAARVRLIDEGEQVVILVADTGPGLPEAQLERVFDPFYRADKSRSPGTGGAGLGLSVARTIVRGHGGDVTLRNLPEGGLEARVTLPR